MHAFEIRFHQALLELIAAQRNREAQHLADGKASDWADYNKRVGVLEGLRLARELANRLAEEVTGHEQDVAKITEGIS
jgi:hypothetical protein